eukprot:m.185962 g.185962  ORF g.185962 m.185962 type:complete len:371 (+) comp32247_c8_seq4:525-1637(+)
MDGKAQQTPNIADDEDGDEDNSDGVWSKEIEDAFEEALAIYPPCGRRKIILSDEGKMYGRNELIALHIFHKTGKQRSRKQVSSHIQVLARKKQRELKTVEPNSQPTTYHGLSSAEIVTQSLAGRGRGNGIGAGFQANGAPYPNGPNSNGWSNNQTQGRLRVLMSQFTGYIQYPNGRAHNFANLVGDSGFTDQNNELLDILQIFDKFPGLRELYSKGNKQSFFLVKFWADLQYDYSMTTQGFFGIDSSYVSTEGMPIECSTSVISLGKQVVEKIQTDSPKLENGRFVYRFNASPMCPYMISFIEKLRNLDNPELMNRVLENFSVVQVVRDLNTQEVLFCCAYLFEISLPNFGTRHHIYKLHEVDPVANRVA